MSHVFDESVMDLDAEQVTNELVHAIRRATLHTLKKRGLVVGVSGGVDSAVVFALGVRAFGADRVTALAMPERESSSESTVLARELCDLFGVPMIIEDVTSTLAAVGCYRRRDDAIRTLVPEFGEGWKVKLALTGESRYQITKVVVEAPDGRVDEVRPTADIYRAIVAASNFKQRTRKMMEYHYADLRGHAVAGTPNRLEYQLGFFVKGGDGQADIKPIAHLYKTQVYQLADYLSVPESIRARPPTTDTFSMAQSQEEFYFTLPYRQMDLCLYALDNGWTAEETALVVDLPPDRVVRVFSDIERKRAVTLPLHLPPLLME